MDAYIDHMHFETYYVLLHFITMYDKANIEEYNA